MGYALTEESARNSRRYVISAAAARCWQQPVGKLKVTGQNSGCRVTV